MSQNIRATRFSCSGRQGIRASVSGSGIAIMSDSSIGLKPLIEEPSNPIAPSSSAALIEKLFSCPSRSVNQRRTKRTSLSSQKASASFAVVGVFSAIGRGNLPALSRNRSLVRRHKEIREAASLVFRKQDEL